MKSNRSSGLSNLDLVEVMKVVEMQSKIFSPTHLYTTKEIVDLINQKFHGKQTFRSEKIYDWKRLGIITPDVMQGSKPSDLYSFEEVKKIMIAHYLWEKGVSLKESIRLAIGFLGGEINSRWRNEFQNGISVVLRARMLLTSRLLSIIVGLVTEMERLPLESVLICRQLDKAEAKSLYQGDENLRTLSNVSDLDMKKMIYGYVTKKPEGEVLIRMDDFFEDTLRMTQDRKYYAILIYDESIVAQPYEVIVGLHSLFEDRQAKVFVYKHELKLIPKVPKELELINQLLNFMFEALSNLEKILFGNDPRYHISIGADLLSVLTTTILLAQNDWLSSVLWTKQDDNHLGIHSYSPSNIIDIERVLTLDEKQNLESSSFNGNGHKIFATKDVEALSFQLPEEDHHILRSPFALIPAISYSGIQGVLFVNAKQGSQYDFSKHIDLLYVLASILAEAYERGKVSSVSHIIALKSRELKHLSERMLSMIPAKLVADVSKAGDRGLIINPIFKSRDVDIDRGLVFVIMPFSESWSERIWKNFLAKIASEEGLRAIRADDLYGRDIMEDIWKGILQSRLIIADITGKNPNVFYELGIAHSLGKQVILLTQNVNDIPFDLNRYRHIIYTDNLDGYQKLEKELRLSIRSLIQDSPS